MHADDLATLVRRCQCHADRAVHAIIRVLDPGELADHALARRSDQYRYT